MNHLTNFMDTWCNQNDIGTTKILRDKSVQSLLEDYAKNSDIDTTEAQKLTRKVMEDYLFFHPLITSNR